MIGLVIVVVSTSSIGRILFGKYILRLRCMEEGTLKTPIP
jgi:hypothetical protein